MHRWMERTLVTVLTVTALLLPALAFAGGGVSVELTAARMISQPGGRESTAPADHAKPGDMIEYRAVYLNQGNAGVRQLDATLPIPAGTEYLAKSAVPAPALASLDGRSFAPLPLKRRVRLADGREAMRDVPASEYRFLRWPLGNLAAHQQRSVRARVRVTNEPVAALTQH